MKVSRILLALSAMFVSHAALAAETTNAAPQGSTFGPLLFLIILIGFMYFLVWRPQQKRAREHRELINAVKENDEVMTSGGIIGSVKTVFESYVEVALNDSTTVILQKSAISQTLPKGTMKSIKEKNVS